VHRYGIADKQLNCIEERCDVRLGKLVSADGVFLRVTPTRFNSLRPRPQSPWLASPRALRPEDWVAHNLIACRQLSTARVVDWRYHMGGVSMRITPAGNLTLSNIEAVAEAVKSGLGIGCVRQWHVQEAQEALVARETGSVPELLRKFRPAPMEVKVDYPSRTRWPKKVRVFIDGLLPHAAFAGQV